MFEYSPELAPSPTSANRPGLGHLAFAVDDVEAATARAEADGKPVLIDFMKHGCQPCQVMDGIVNEVADEFQEEGAAIREWYVADGAMLLFITYSCDEENRGMDDAAVDELLDTLLLVA